jgi:DNA mismatch repair protein MutL
MPLTDAPNPASRAQPEHRPLPEIRRLPTLLVNQIAAGEVIERPASVVKELVENAIDAHAARIAIDLEGGGVELVRVADDGVGMTPDQLTLAIAPHATSKIKDAADLDRIATMGFRGEALASIVSVARVTIRSRTHTGEGAQTDAAQLDAEGDRIGPVRPAAGPRGTTIEVRNLFFNTPARRKFLRTPATEQGRCLDWIRDLAMAHPAIAFRVTADSSVKLDLPPDQGPRDRALALLGRELESQLLEISSEDHHPAFAGPRPLTLWGLVGTPAVARATAKAQHVFLNGRAIRDKSIQHALREAYRGLIEPGRHPTAVLMLEMPPGGVDVNVHPAKLEVRFRDQSLVHQTVLRSVRDALQRADLTPGVLQKLGHPHHHQPARNPVGPTAILPTSPATAANTPSPSAPAEQFARYFSRDLPAAAGGRIDFDAVRRAIAGADALPTPTDHTDPPVPTADNATFAGVRAVERVLQIHNSYLVTQDERGLVLIDQHALHERVMFERLLARLHASGSLESQRLLTPAVVDATREHIDRLDELTPLFDTLGIEAAAMGPRSIGLRAFPTLLFERGVEPAAFLAELLASLDRGEGLAAGGEEALHEVLDMMACKAAVKAGDRLSDHEMAEILEARQRVERSGSCPHGRATTVRLTIADLEKLFDRR